MTKVGLLLDDVAKGEECFLFGDLVGNQVFECAAPQGIQTGLIVVFRNSHMD